jgi:hypothetical protein
MYSLCQRCKDEHTNSWNVKQAEFHVGRIDHWKVQLCADCHVLVEQAVLAALKDATRPTPSIKDVPILFGPPIQYVTKDSLGGDR